MNYNVYLENLDPEELNEAAKWLFETWCEFAIGAISLGGVQLQYPTGEYRKSIKLIKNSDNSYSIVADSEVANILETGHASYDMKQLGYRTYPMKRMGLVHTGYATVGKNSAPDSWIIPAMPAYAPAKILTEMLAQKYGSMSPL